MKKRIFALFLLMPFIQNAEALTNKGCGHLHIQIANTTFVSCVLTNQEIVHGYLISAPPAVIMQNDSKFFDMEQTGYGPSITLGYQCGSENISFTSQQNFCLVEAGDISGNLLHPLPENINATYTAETGSYLWNKPGNINWKIYKYYET